MLRFFAYVGFMFILAGVALVAPLGVAFHLGFTSQAAAIVALVVGVGLASVIDYHMIGWLWKNWDRLV